MAKVLISMREDFLEQVDHMAETEQRTRSELIRQALRECISARRPKAANAAQTQRNAELIEALLLS